MSGVRSTAGAYGIQREMLSMARHDEAGQPRAHRYLNIFEMIRIRGPLSLPLLEKAAWLVSADIDIFRSRFRATPSGHELFLAPSRRWLSFEVMTSGEAPDRFPGSTAGEALRSLAHTSRDLQCEPLAQIRVVRRADDDHLMLIVLDHSVADGRTLMVFIREIARCYSGLLRGEDFRTSFSGFLEFAGRFGEETPERAAGRAYWMKALARAADPLSQPRFPGGRWKPRRDRRLSHRVENPLHGAEWSALARAAERLTISVPQLVFAASALAVCAWSAVFAPINYFRHGRSDRDSINVPGPLADHCVTVEPPDTDGSLGGWLREFVRVNEGGPALHGLSFRELETPDTDDNRLVLFNYLPSVGVSRFGEATGRWAGSAFIKALREYDYSSRFAVRFHLWRYPGEPMVLAVDHDPEVLPRGQDLIAQTLHVIHAADESPATPIESIKHALRRD